MLRDDIISFVLNNIDHVRLNGHPTDRLPGNANFSFNYIEGESLLLMLDMKESAHPADPHAHPGPWILPMYCWQSDCPMRWRTAP